MTRRIVINGRFLGRPITGVERFALETVRAIDGLCRDKHPACEGLQVVIAAPKGIAIGPAFTHLAIERTGRLGGHAWEQVELPFFAGRDPVINLCNTGPLLKRRAVTCVHDAHVWLAPENFSVSFRLAYKVLVPALLRIHRSWTTVSRFSETTLRALRVAPGPAGAITHNGSEHVTTWNGGRSTLAALPARFVFALASRAPLKNTGLVFALAERLQGTGIDVVVAGASNPRIFGETRPSTSRPANVVELGRVSDDDIAALMARAVCFVFPSLHEGFGLPPIEAMALGCPVVASNCSALPEILGDAAILCPPHDSAAWERAVTDLASDEGLRSMHVARGRATAAQFTWPRTALTMLELAVAA